MLRKLLFLVAILVVAIATIAFDGAVMAQNAPFYPQVLSGTTTGSFVQIMGREDSRHGCIVQNNGTNKMYVYPDTAANATTAGTAKSLVLPPGSAMACADVNSAMASPISVNGTNGDAYYAADW